LLARMLTLNHFCCSLISIRRLQTFLGSPAIFPLFVSVRASFLRTRVCVCQCVCLCNYLCCSFVQRPRQLNKREGRGKMGTEGLGRGVGAIKGSHVVVFCDSIFRAWTWPKGTYHLHAKPASGTAKNLSHKESQ